MEITVRALIKGTSITEAGSKSKNPGTKYHKVDMYAMDGKALDLQAACDMSNGGAVLFEQAGKMRGQTAMAKIELTLFDRRANFQLLGLQPVK
jgi:hypothetical protein